MKICEIEFNCRTDIFCECMECPRSEKECWVDMASDGSTVEEQILKFFRTILAGEDVET